MRAGPRPGESLRRLSARPTGQSNRSSRSESGCIRVPQNRAGEPDQGKRHCSASSLTLLSRVWMPTAKPSRQGRAFRQKLVAEVEPPLPLCSIQSISIQGDPVRRDAGYPRGRTASRTEWATAQPPGQTSSNTPTTPWKRGNSWRSPEAPPSALVPDHAVGTPKDTNAPSNHSPGQRGRPSALETRSRGIVLPRKAGRFHCRISLNILHT